LLSEAVHSASDTLNQITLLMGKRMAKKRNVRKYPFGGYRARYLASFLVAVMLFSLGGVYVIYVSVNKILDIFDPETIEGIEANPLWIGLGILLLSAVLEGNSLRVAIRDAQIRMSEEKFRSKSLIQFWRKTKSSELMVILTEDTIALIGLFCASVGIICTIITENPLFDAVGGGIVGILLIGAAIVLGREIGSLVIGESVSTHTKNVITRTVENNAKVDKFINMQAIHLSESDLLICLKVDLVDTLKISDAAAVNDIERQIRKALPRFNCEIYVECDIFDPHYHKPRRPRVY
jgi:cation diffusion facilitator family transporter